MLLYMLLATTSVSPHLAERELKGFSILYVAPVAGMRPSWRHACPREGVEGKTKHKLFLFLFLLQELPATAPRARRRKKGGNFRKLLLLGEFPEAEGSAKTHAKLPGQEAARIPGSC